MKRLFLSVSFVLAFLMGSAQTGGDYENAVREFLEVTNAKETSTVAMLTMYQNMNLPVSDLQGMCEEMVDAMWPKTVEEYNVILSEYYTLEELEAIISFYKSPAGQKLVKYNPEIMQKAMNFGASPEIMVILQPILMKHLDY